MEKKILLLFLYIGLLVFIKNQDLMKVQENRGFYIDNIDLNKDAFLEATLCSKTKSAEEQGPENIQLKRLDSIDIIYRNKITS